MPRTCHRCSAALPFVQGGTRVGGDEEQALYCRECGAPQIMMPEYLRAEAGGSGARTTGEVPPPRPQLVEWQVAILCAAPVAAATGILTIVAEVAPQAGFLDTLCVLLGTGVVLALYRARLPLARIDGRIGLRVGLLTGLLMVAAIATSLSAAGVVARFATHGMAGFDAELAKSQALGLQMSSQMFAGSVDSATQQQIRQQQISWLESPEFRAGSELSQLTLLSLFVLTMTTLSGGFAGLVQRRRRDRQSPH